MNKRTIEETIRNTIEEQGLIRPGDHVVLGFSGGPDSLTLFEILVALAKTMHFDLYCVHVNHGLRPGAAEEDEAFAASWCRVRQIDLTTVRADCHALAEQWEMTDEEAGRKLRYDAFFARCAKLVKEGVDPERIKVAVAHNRDDQVETVLQRILRGSGPDGLAGMAYRRTDESGYTVIRPLLDVPREAIEAYCKENNLEPRRDLTNEEPVYNRNKIRLELVPYLEENYNPNIGEAILRLSRIAAEDKEHLANETAEAFAGMLLGEEKERCILDRSKLSACSAALRHRLFRKALSEAGLARDVTHTHILAADDLLRGARYSGSMDFPRGYRMEVADDKVIFEGPGAEVRKAAPVSLINMAKPLKLKVGIAEDEPYEPALGEAVFDLDLLEKALPPGLPVMKDLRLRSRQEGDYLALKDGRKRIQDLLVDEKVPADIRHLIPMVAIGSEILWIPAGEMSARYSAEYKVTEATRRLLILAIDG